MATVPKSVVDRYYERRYVTDVGGRKGHHQYVHIHSNRLLVLGVTAEHVALKDMEEVVIDSKRKENQVKGKRKNIRLMSLGSYIGVTLLLCGLQECGSA
mmetsp:Transcript_10423/g.27309  ORF Transcript_10423/g.27309 Transcript_10423/m.27309 type:complete len:99 (-) Transcript_10423:1106-1402(-)